LHLIKAAVTAAAAAPAEATSNRTVSVASDQTFSNINNADSLLTGRSENKENESIATSTNTSSRVAFKDDDLKGENFHPDLAKLAKNKDVTKTNTSIRIKKEKSFIIDLYNKTTNSHFETPSPILINTPRLKSPAPTNHHSSPPPTHSKEMTKSHEIHTNYSENTSNNLSELEMNQPGLNIKNSKIDTTTHTNITNTNNDVNKHLLNLSTSINNDPFYDNNLTNRSNQGYSNGNKATEDFLNEIRMSHQSLQTPKPKKLYSNSPSSQKPPHMLPPLTPNRKFMSYGNIDNSYNYDVSLSQQLSPRANPNETYSNNFTYINGQNRNHSLPNSRGINNFDTNNNHLGRSDEYSASDLANQEFDALQSRRKLLHELSVTIFGYSMS